MKTKHPLFKHPVFVTRKEILSLIILFTTLVTINSCDKVDIPGVPGFKQTSATVATDWYRLQLRILLERNSAFNGIYFEYIGTGLYEAVRNDIPFAVSFSTKLYHMPAMPAKEEGKSYNWQLSANAAMAAMVRSFYNGLTPENSASIDSLENAWNTRLKNGTSNEEFARSQSFGRSIATAIYNWYLTDDLNPSNVGYVPPVCPSCWIPTPPAFINPPVLPFIGKAHTFLAANYGTLVPAFPLPYSESPKSSYYQMAHQLYDLSKVLTDEQKILHYTGLTGATVLA